MDAGQVASCSSAVASVILSWVWQSLLLGTAFAGLTCLLIRLLKLRIGSTLETGLWVIVLIKFLIPMGLFWAFSLSSVHRELFLRASARNTVLPDPAASDGARSYVVEVDLLDSGTLAALTMPEPSPDAEDTASSQGHWTTFIGIGYLLCVLGLLAVRVRSYHALVRRCQSLPTADAHTCNIAGNVCRRLGVRRTPSIRVSDEHPPFVIGFVRPLLIVSRHLLVRPDEMETVIVHEIAHLRRGDLFVRYLEWIAGTLFFFWPVVAWINRRLETAREYACDEWALRHGKLTAPEYARCLLRVVQPVCRRRFAYAPCSMANHAKAIERRIDMILQSRRYPPGRRMCSLLACVFLFAWAGLALTGIAAGPDRVADAPSRSASEASVHTRAAALYNLVREHDAADFNGDGVLSYLEKDTYLVALAMRQAEPFMEAFPYADRNHSGNLDIIEARDVIRAVTLVAYADRRVRAASELALPLEFCQCALDAQQWLLDRSTSEPLPGELDQIWSVLRRIQGHPTSFAARMLDHGAPVQLDGDGKDDRAPRSQFHELEGNIAAIEDRLTTTVDPDKIATLELMLAELQAILSRLQQ